MSHSWSRFFVSHYDLTFTHRITVDWPQWVTQGASGWRHQQHLLTSSGGSTGLRPRVRQRANLYNNTPRRGWEKKKNERGQWVRQLCSIKGTKPEVRREGTQRELKMVRKSWREWGGDARKGEEVWGDKPSKLKEKAAREFQQEGGGTLSSPEWVESSSDKSP